jgi:nitrite reductase/ring-hydroxylating ferredoxin subunit
LDTELTAETNVKEGGIFMMLLWNDRSLLLLKRKGKVYAYVNVCQHVGGNLALEEDTLVCQWHGSTYDALTGKRKSGPAPEQSELVPLPITIKDGKVYYSFPPSKPRGQWHIA